MTVAVVDPFVSVRGPREPHPWLFEPVEVFVRGAVEEMPNAQVAARIGLRPPPRGNPMRQLARFRTIGLTDREADLICTILERHPREFWGDDWDDYLTDEG